ncbi:hypothetical protein RBH29_04030 [Herbivorax sp. ANBcel31]|uniref:hypothetical protein n=1 Tax=Herbivorax sp. ANBcel31 TaxID=3069754 RepID=UPI0027B12A66|nr:hypothetical protein [Herbivorax sp. ANBcel31]MDQ2085602.1 hypothetical protein [Herbivorax sp. ANBcel31]
MKSLKFAKFQIAEMIPSTGIFYLIFLLVLIFLVSLNSSNGNTNTSGLEFASIIFLFILGLSCFRSSFNFSQANNISRKLFYKGTIMSIFPIAMTMSILDLIINRIYNNFIPSPTNFDMIYGSYRDTGMRDASGVITWVQENDVFTLLGTTIWQFALYSLVFITGILITLIYYRSNKPLKVLVSVVPVMLIISLNTTSGWISQSFLSGIKDFAAFAFLENSYLAALSYGIIGAVFSMFIYLLTKRAIIKD